MSDDEMYKLLSKTFGMYNDEKLSVEKIEASDILEDLIIRRKRDKKIEILLDETKIKK